eukprot:SAG31_NODE_304_length_18019_cov_10.386440_13_plen_150_part_00
MGGAGARPLGGRGGAPAAGQPRRAGGGRQALLRRLLLLDGGCLRGGAGQEAAGLLRVPAAAVLPVPDLDGDVRPGVVGGVAPQHAHGRAALARLEGVDEHRHDLLAVRSGGGADAELLLHLRHVLQQVEAHVAVWPRAPRVYNNNIVIR